VHKRFTEACTLARAQVRADSSLVKSESQREGEVVNQSAGGA